MSTTTRHGLRRALAITAAAVAAALLTGPAANAADDSYVPPEPTIEFDVLSPICDGDVPYLQYEVKVTGTPNDTVTITWLNPSGANVVQSGLPLSGRVLWPGAVVGPDGRGADWPGWSLQNGTWVEGDEFDWVRPSVDVLFQVNPEATVTVAYPPSSPNCATNPPGKTNPTPSASEISYQHPSADNPSLAATGTTVGLAVGLAALLAALGTAIVLLTRRTRRS